MNWLERFGVRVAAFILDLVGCEVEVRATCDTCDSDTHIGINVPRLLYRCLRKAES